MKLGVLFSGGKDSTYAAWLAKKEGYEISCLISLVSENPHSFMFHTPSINATEYQARAMGIPIIIQKTKGKKELELRDLKAAIKKAIKGYGIEGIVTGAVESVYQSSRIQKICNELDLECFNPLWQKDQIELLQDLVKDKFEVMIVGVFAYPLDKSWLGRIIDKRFINEVAILRRKYQINPAGEGGEFETLTLFAPDLFKKRLKIKSFQDFLEGENAGRREVRI
ncbi:MAG: diphthine--ammonia ligase, partial [Nanoarchaeota archaeon]|nr:diphthine--ammonia ligase [Nanoarchaeota archaeon]